MGKRLVTALGIVTVLLAGCGSTPTVTTAPQATTAATSAATSAATAAATAADQPTAAATAAATTAATAGATTAATAEAIEKALTSSKEWPVVALPDQHRHQVHRRNQEHASARDAVGTDGRR